MPGLAKSNQLPDILNMFLHAMGKEEITWQNILRHFGISIMLGNCELKRVKINGRITHFVLSSYPLYDCPNFTHGFHAVWPKISIFCFSYS